MLDHNGSLVSYRKDRLTARCPNHTLFALMPSHLPRTHCPPGKKCYCGATFSIDRADLPNSFQPRLWGTTRWARDYFRRNLVGTHNLYAQTHAGESNTTYRVPAPKWELFRMMKAIGITMLNIHTWMCRLGVAHAHTHTPEIAKAAIAPHLEPPDPAPSQRTGRLPVRGPRRGSIMSPHPNQVTANQHGGQPPLPENS